MENLNINETKLLTVTELLEKNKGETPLYFQVARQLQQLAITKFAIKEEKNNGLIVTTSTIVNMKRIDNNEIVTVFDGYLKWKYPNSDNQYYIQFNSNPFFPTKGYVEYYTDTKRISTGLADIPYTIILGNYFVEEYSIESENIELLSKCIKDAVDWLKTLSFIFKDNRVSYRDTIDQSHIYYNR